MQYTETFGPAGLDQPNLENSHPSDSEPVEPSVFDSDPNDHREDHRSTGPRTPAGKAISSRNATKHGCRSKTLILRHEDPTEYEALCESWWGEYQPLGHIEETLVQQLIDNHWFLKRAATRMEQVEWELPANVHEWTDTHKKLVNTFQRYKRTAERAFQKSLREVEAYFRGCLRAENAAHKADLLCLKIEAQIAKKPVEANQIALKMAIPLYNDRRSRALARGKMQPFDREICIFTGCPPLPGHKPC